MLNLDEIREELKDRRIPFISSVTGVGYNTIKEIRDNPDANPTYKVIKALNDYFSGTVETTTK